MRWRESIFYNYEGYFGKPKIVNEEEKPLSPTMSSFNYKKWQYHLMVHKLVEELNMKPDEVWKMNYIDCLNWLSLFNERDKEIKKLNK